MLVRAGDCYSVFWNECGGDLDISESRLLICPYDYLKVFLSEEHSQLCQVWLCNLSDDCET